MSAQESIGYVDELGLSTVAVEETDWINYTDGTYETLAEDVKLNTPSVTSATWTGQTTTVYSAVIEATRVGSLSLFSSSWVTYGNIIYSRYPIESLRVLGPSVFSTNWT